MKKALKIFIILLAIFIGNNIVFAKDKSIVNIYLFHSEYCSHCKEEIKFLKRIEKKNKNVNVYKYEVSKSENEMEIANNIYNIEIETVPTLIIGEKIYTGYSEEKTPLIVLSTIDYYSKYGYVDNLGIELGIDNLPKEISNKITIDEYNNNILNKKVLFNIKRKDINMEMLSLISLIKANINIINILFLIIVSFSLIKYKKDTKSKLITIALIVLIRIILNIIYYLNLLNSNLEVLLVLSALIGLIILIIMEKKHIIKKRLLMKIELIEIILYIIQHLLFKNNININFINRYYLPNLIENLILFLEQIIEPVLMNLPLLLLVYTIFKRINEKRKKI